MRGLLIFFGTMMMMMTTTTARTMMIGDSMFDGSPICNDLAAWANTTISNHARSGAAIHGGWILSIPDQYEEIRDDDCTTIIMDGGGNDILAQEDECHALSDSCRDLIDTVAEDLETLLEHMEEGTVQHVLYLGFYYLPGFEQAIDYGTDHLLRICEQSTLDCHFADPRNLTIPLSWDGIHPTQEGFTMLAQRLWDVKTLYQIPFPSR